MRALRLRPALRQHIAHPLSRHPLISIRHQHGTDYGPHKEYFQTPGQIPLPDTTPYNPNLPAHQQHPSFHHAQPPPAENTGPSILVRTLRSLFWGVLFTSSGLLFGTGLISWEYLQKPFEPGSEEEQELHESVVAAVEQHPVVEALRNENWSEEDFYTHAANKTPISVGGVSRNMVHDQLTGTQGLLVKAFRNHAAKTTVLVFFPGFGVEGWPDTCHGGVIASMFLEGFRRHLDMYYPEYSPGLDAEEQNQILSVDFKIPVRPGEVYTVLIPPAGIAHGVDIQGRARVELVSFLMQLETAPKVHSVHDLKENMDKHTIEIVSQGNPHITHAIAILKMHSEPTSVVDITQEIKKP